MKWDNNGFIIVDYYGPKSLIMVISWDFIG